MLLFNLTHNDKYIKRCNRPVTAIVIKLLLKQGNRVEETFIVCNKFDFNTYHLFLFIWFLSVLQYLFYHNVKISCESSYAKISRF